MAQDYFEDPRSGAWIFSPDPSKSLAEENKKLKDLLAAVISALPADVTRKIPQEHLKAVSPDGDQ